jgi:DNA polymerase-3 subunit epsilon
MNGRLKQMTLKKSHNHLLEYSERKTVTTYVVMDVETTGLYPARGDRVIELGAVLLNNGDIISEFASLINCGKVIPKTAHRVHGITGEMLLEAPPPEEVFPRFLEFLSRSTVVAHNAKFDIKFLRYELARLGLGITNKYVCTMKMSKKRFPHLPNHKLGTVAQHILGELPTGLRLHRALDDARLTAMVWREMEKR